MRRLSAAIMQVPLWALLLVLGTGCSSIQSHRHLAGEYDLGPIASKHQSINGELQQKIAGPFFEKTSSEKGDNFVALRPAYAQMISADGKHKIREVIWPLATTRKKDKATTWRVLTVLGANWDVDNPASRYRLWVLPFWFQGRDKHGEDHAALFPLYGKINEFMGRDEINFTLFPLYATSRVKDMKTRSVVWPIYSKTVGDGIYRHRVFPFYGVSKKKNRFDRYFCMWPIWNSVKFQNRDSQGSGFCIFPLYAQAQFNEQKIHWFVPPFIRINQGGENGRSHVLWPLFQSSKGDISKLYLWPLFGTKTIGHVENTFVAWPIFSRRHLDRSREDVYRTYLLPFYYGHTSIPKVERSVKTDKKIYRKIWPLFSYQKEQGVSRFRCFELWPIKNSAPIERNWAPFWTIYTNRSTDQASESELLWGMYRRQIRADGTKYTSIFPVIDWSKSLSAEGEIQKSWSILKGLIGFDVKDDQKSFRLLYFLTFGGTKT